MALVLAVAVGGCTKEGPAGKDGINGKDGSDGVDGKDGRDGKNGNVIITGNGVPDSGLGNIGDYYFDRLTTNLYGAKTANGWGMPVSLKGLQGDAGQNGTNGTNGSKILSGTTPPTNDVGNIGDWYIDTQAGRLYGAKTSIGWGTSIALSNTCANSKADFLISDDGTILLQWRNKNSTSIDMTTIPELANVTKIGNRAFYGCVDATTIKLTDKITYIGHYAFEQCSRLVDLHIPKNVTHIGTWFIQGTKKLTRFYVEAETPPTLVSVDIAGYGDDYRFGYYSYVEEIYVPASSLETYKNNPQWKALTDIQNCTYDPTTGNNICTITGSKLKAL